MREQLKIKFKESSLSILPVTFIVLILNVILQIVNNANNLGMDILSFKETLVFLFGSLMLIVGMTLFTLGADISLSSMGGHIGAGLIKSRKLKVLTISALILGILITLAEPDLSVLASQVPFSGTLLKWMIAIGVGIFLCVALIRSIFQISLKKLLAICYGIAGIVSIVLLATDKGAFLGVSFDSGGVTTGPVTVPFIMALGLGVASISIRKDGKDNGFGLVALCSIGPILAVLLLSLLSDGGKLSYGELEVLSLDSISLYFNHILEYVKEVGIALLPMIVFFLIFNFFMLHIEKKHIVKILIGLGYTFLGLVFFLNAVNSGFLIVGRIMGMALGEHAKGIIVPVGFILGVVSVLAEPAIHSLNKQVADISGGAISKKSMMISLSIGVGCAIALSLIRIIFDFSLMYYLIPGYSIALILMIFVPDIYTAIAFDSGGVASGPMTAGFVLPFAIGACFMINGSESIISAAFGVVSMVALIPLIAIQCLGLSVVIKSNIRKRIEINRNKLLNENEIINFNI